MLYVFGFERTAVVLSDLYFVDPHPMPGQESPEHGARLEVRQLSAGELKGSIYSAQPIEIGELIWRADLLESVDGTPGSFDRTHHHPVAEHGWEPGHRVFERELSAFPVEWVGAKLADLEGLLAQAGRGRPAGRPAGRAGPAQRAARGIERPQPAARPGPRRGTWPAAGRRALPG